MNVMEGMRFSGAWPWVFAALELLAILVPGHATAQTLEGRLLDGSTDQGISDGVLIMVSAEGDSVGSAISSEDGRFSISADAPGSYVLIASAYGYHESRQGMFELGDSAVMTMEYRLAPAPLPIEEVIVQLGARRGLRPKVVRSGFVRRMERGLGHFITPYDIERSPDTSTSDLLDRLPGVFLGGSSLTTYAGRALLLQGSYGTCKPHIYLDGIRVEQNGDIDALAPLHDIEAIEVYRRRTEVPLQYAIGDQGCGVVLFWTKD